MIYTITGATGNLGEKIMAEALKYIKPSELRLAVRSTYGTHYRIQK